MRLRDTVWPYSAAAAAVETMEHFFTCPVAGAAIEIARARVCSTLRDAAVKPTTPAAPRDDSARKRYRRELGLAVAEAGV